MIFEVTHLRSVSNLQSMTDIHMHLREMGLSEYETSAYVSLLCQGTSTASEISADADIPQSRVYDILGTLETKGFVVIQPGRPKKFGPVAPEVAVDQFCSLRRRQYREELDEIRGRGECLQDAVSDIDRTADSGDIDISWSYSNRHHILEKLAALADSAESEVLMISTPKSFERIVTHHTEQLIANAADGVRTRALVSTDRRIKTPVLEKASEMMDIRLVEDIEGRLYLYDSAEIVLAFQTPETDGYVGTSMVSPHLYRTFLHLFELMWEESAPVERMDELVTA